VSEASARLWPMPNDTTYFSGENVP
jgi:hypothetical protein